MMHGIVPRGPRRQARRCCEHCGTPFTLKRAARRQYYCSGKCRDADRRERNFRRFGVTRRGSQAVPRSVENTDLISSTCKGDFGDRASTEIALSTLSPPAFHGAADKVKAIAEHVRHHPVPPPLTGPKDYPINVTGGYHFANTPKIEFGPLLAETVSADPAVATLIATIPEDLSIPPFLRRMPETSA